MRDQKNLFSWLAVGRLYKACNSQSRPIKDGNTLNTWRQKKRNSKHREEHEHRNIDGNTLGINDIEWFESDY